MARLHLPRLRVLFWTVFFAVALGGALGVGGLLGYIETHPPVEELEDYAPPETTEVYDSQQKMHLAEFFTQRRIPKTYEELSQPLINAFLAIEDRRFFEHCGIDPQGILRAAVHDLKAGRKAEGGSTITQELAGGVDHGIDRSDKSISRKINEALDALEIEHRFTKQEIITFYLNQIYLGNGCFGVEAAAEQYFGKSIDKLSIAECAMLAGLPQAPSRINPAVNLSKSIERRNVVLKAMLDGSYITQQEYDKACVETPHILKIKPSDSYYKAPYFINYMCASLQDTAQFLDLAANAKQDPMEFFKSGGFTVITTLDAKLQHIAEDTMREGLSRAEMEWHVNAGARMAKDPQESTDPQVGQERIGTILDVTDKTIRINVHGYTADLPRPAVPALYNPDKIIKQGELLDCRVDQVDSRHQRFTGVMLPDSKIKGAMVVLEPKTGRVLAMVGGDDYFDKNEPKAQWNFATQGGRQPGSGAKPLFYAAAVKAGFPPNRRFLNVPFDINGYTGRNYSPTYEGGMMTMQEGLERSQNVMMLRVFSALGFSPAVNFVRQFDFAWTKPHWDIPNNQAAVCLGSFSVTPLELATAYATFANGGEETRPYAVDQILNRKGEVIYTAHPERKKLLSEQEAYQMVSMMRGVLGPRGTGAELAKHFAEEKNLPEMAGKTGTTNDVKDAWFNGYTPDLLVSIFVGFDPPRPLGGKMTGSTLAGPIFQDFMDQALKTRTDWTMKFPAPAGLVRKTIDLGSGEPVPDWSKSSDPEREADMWFIAKTGAPGATTEKTAF